MSLCIATIRRQINRYYREHPDAVRTPTDDNPELRQMQRLLLNIDTSIKVEKSGDDPAFMKLVQFQLLDGGAAAVASNMMAGYDTGFNPPGEGDAVRIQNLLRHLVEGEPVPQVVARAIGASRLNPEALVAMLQSLVARHPHVGENANWRQLG